MTLLEATTIALPLVPTLSQLLRHTRVHRLLVDSVKPRGICQVLPFLCPR